MTDRYRIQIPKQSLSPNKAVDDDNIVMKNIEDTISDDFNSFLSLDDSAITTKSSRPIRTKKKRRKKKEIDSDNNENENNNDNNDDDNNDNNDNNNKESKNDNNNDNSDNRVGSKLLKRLNYFWGNVKKNSAKTKYDSTSRKNNLVMKEERIRQSLIKLFQLQYERELKEKEEKASKRMTQRLLSLIMNDKSNTTTNNSSSSGNLLLPSIFQKRK